MSKQIRMRSRFDPADQYDNALQRYGSGGPSKAATAVIDTPGSRLSDDDAEAVAAHLSTLIGADTSLLRVLASGGAVFPGAVVAELTRLPLNVYSSPECQAFDYWLGEYTS